MVRTRGSRLDSFVAHAKALAAAPKVLLGALLLAGLAGCEVDSWFDPSRTGSFSTTATTMPVLSRIDIIESDTVAWRNAGPPTPEDLLPSDVLYRLQPGDVVRVEIYELLRAGEMSVVVRAVDQAGNIRVPRIGDIPVAGLTPQEVQEEIENRLRGLLADPTVSVALEQERNLIFTVLGRTANQAPYRLVRPDLRLLEALAIAGGVPETTDRLYIIRRTALDTSVSPPWAGDVPVRPGARQPDRRTAEPVDIEALIRELEQREGGATPPPPPPPQDGTDSDPDAPPGANPPGLAMVRGPQQAPVDVDDLQPVHVPERTAAQRGDGRANAIRTDGPAETFVFDRSRNAWVRVRAGAGGGAPAGGEGAAGGPVGADILEQDAQEADVAGGGQPLFAERVIVIDYKRLITGDSSQNIVIRPNDLIVVQGFEFGFVYIDGEIIRPGSYELPITGGLTISRLVAAAGGLNPLAIPERVDLTRKIGPGREATVRVNVAAIRRRTEPDFILKPDDHIIIGTNFLATPLAVIRNGFRMTYGFGFLLDRNFGNDVFGAPPTNVIGQ